MHKIIFFFQKKICVPTLPNFSNPFPEIYFFIWPYLDRQDQIAISKVSIQIRLFLLLQIFGRVIRLMDAFTGVLG